MSLICQIIKHTFLHEINFSLSKGEIIVIIGTNGAGKSTLLREIIGFTQEKFKQEKIILDEKKLTSYTLKELSQKISYIPQNVEASFSLSVLELILLGKLPFGKTINHFNEQDENQLKEILETCGLIFLEERRFDRLSGGEKMRALIAQALFKNSPYILADEPLTGLDIHYQFKIMDIFKKLSKENNYACLLVLHDIGHALSYADKILILEKGHQIIFDTPNNIMKTNILSEVFKVHIAFSNDALIVKQL